MFDRSIQSALASVWHAVAAPLERMGVTPNQVTAAAWVTGLISAGLIASHQFSWALLCLLISRSLDALDGALARRVGVTDAGGYADIVLDFWFYAAIPLAFAAANPSSNALAAAALLASFLLNATSWLALTSMRPPATFENVPSQRKSLVFIASLAEGAETLVIYIAMCLWPNQFSWIAWGFAALCLVSACQRTHMGWKLLSRPGAQTSTTPE